MHQLPRAPALRLRSAANACVFSPAIVCARLVNKDLRGHPAGEDRDRLLAIVMRAGAGAIEAQALSRLAVYTHNVDVHALRGNDGVL